MRTQITSESAHHATVVLALALVLLASPSIQAGSSPEWEVALNQEGVKVLTREVPGSSYDEYKGITTVPASAASVMAIFTDPNANKKWLEGCTKVKTIDYSGFYSQTVYQIYDFPWPATDRDFVIEFEVEQTGDNEFFMAMHDRSGQVPEKPDLVRAEMVSGYYEIKQLSPDKTKIVMAQHVSPSGNLPSWMVNSLITDTPYYSLKSFRSMVSDKKYSDATFVRDEQGKIESVTR